MGYKRTKEAQIKYKVQCWYIFNLCLHASKTCFVKDVQKDDEKRR